MFFLLSYKMNKIRKKYETHQFFIKNQYKSTIHKIHIIIYKKLIYNDNEFKKNEYFTISKQFFFLIVWT